MTVNNFVISYQVHVSIICILLFSSNVIYQLQTVSSRQERSWREKNIARGEKEVFLEKYIELFASSRLCCGVVHSMVRLHWIKNKLARNKKYFG
jgi:hypothetical protein